MKRTAYFRSLRFKITAGVTVVMVVIVALYAYIQYESQRAMVIRDAGETLTNTSQLIKGSLQSGMLKQDFGDLQSIFDNAGSQPGIKALMLLDPRDVIRLSPGKRGVGTQLDRSDPNCQVCHQQEAQLAQRNIVYTTADGERILRNCNPVENLPTCYECHDASVRFNGVLITDFSFAETDAHLAEALRTTLLLGGAAIGLVILTINLLMNRLVLTRLGHVVSVVRRFAEGDLSQRVVTRADDELGELAEAFNRMATTLQEDNQEKVRLYAELQQKEAVRTQLLEKLIRAQEEERIRIARDLHDQLGATLGGLTLSIEAAEQSLPPEVDSLRRRWERAKDLANQALAETQKLILELRPVILDDLGLFAAIRADAEGRLKPRGIAVRVNVTGTKRRIAPELELTLFRIVQEAINNIVKHAKARHVNIALEFKDSNITVTVEDDGQGFDVEAVARSDDRTRGLGLLGMVERAQLAGGSFRIESKVGYGSRIVLTMPAPIGDDFDGKHSFKDSRARRG